MLAYYKPVIKMVLENTINIDLFEYLVFSSSVFKLLAKNDVFGVHFML